MAMTSVQFSVMDLRLPHPSGVLEMVASSAGTLTEGLGFLKRQQNVDTVSPSGFPPGRDVWKASLKASSLRAIDLKSTVLGALSVGGLVATAAQAALSPRGPGTCDRNMCERCCNITTSIPYVVCGCHAMRHRSTASGKTWGASMVGVGAASALFHGSYGSVREWGRRMDFWTIAAASNLMTRALFPGVPASVTAAGMLATPFKPFLVSFVNSTAMELKFMAAARRNPKLRGPQRLHATCCLLGLGAFALEDWKPDLPLVHSVWHLLSSVSVATINNLLADVEEQQQLQQARSVQRPPQLVLHMQPLHA
ncbi:hypothetical protein PLESTB_000486400 [Pleodorina starrii]|uniref:Uncharacterized protein n=1 Tax=Pleodorina starrii TaxID=330485 RepID=A0A9W6BFR1_9CHLO|nr:hypothetical protein PLESTM_000357600 [Pleodorina starrii]GLC51289.1 hypothetical protein PLESTB_000486400 [Pleodorina starrii]GLC63649.1 hypothetical protein PLESTF_000059300 [Pleodorina starrii]